MNVVSLSLSLCLVYLLSFVVMLNTGNWVYTLGSDEINILLQIQQNICEVSKVKVNSLLLFSYYLILGSHSLLHGFHLLPLSC